MGAEKLNGVKLQIKIFGHEEARGKGEAIQEVVVSAPDIHQAAKRAARHLELIAEDHEPQDRGIEEGPRLGRKDGGR